MPEESPAHHIRDLSFSVGHAAPPRIFLKHIPSFTNVKEITLSGVESFKLLSASSLWRSVASLTVSAIGITPLQVRDVMVRLPNLDDLWLKEFRDSKASPGVGAVSWICYWRSQLGYILPRRPLSVHPNPSSLLSGSRKHVPRPS